MRKESAKYIGPIFLAVLTAMLLVSCGGGGGGGGMVAFSNNSELHNGGDAGGWGGSGGGINNGSNSNGEVELIITGSTPLNVTGYIYNGTTYPDAASLLNVLSTSTLPDFFTVDFTVDVGGTTETREARVSANGTAGNGHDIFIEHQYKAGITTEDGAAQEVYFYKRDGISLASFATNPDTGTGGVSFDQIGWTDGNGIYPTDGALPYPAGQNGDIIISGLAPAYDKMKVSDGKVAFYPSMVKNGDSFKIPAGVTVNEIHLPTASNPRKLISLDLSDAVLPTSIGDDFLGNGGVFVQLKEIKLPNTGITEIGDNAFNGCSDLTSVNIPSSVTTIGYRAFLSCESLTKIEIPPSVTTIGSEAFNQCEALEEINIPDGVATISSNLFNGCANLQTVNIPDGVTTIEEYAFRGCAKLKNVNYSNRIELPSSITNIGQGAFENSCSDPSLAAPNSVQLWFYSNPALGQDAFKGCTYITFLRSQADSFTPAANAFSDCSNLKELALYAPSSIQINSDMFSGLATGERITIYFGSLRTGSGVNIQDKSIILTTGTNIFDKTPHMSSSTPAYNSQFSISGSSWGGKSVIVKHDSGTANYYTWNGSDFTATASSPAPAEWND